MQPCPVLFIVLTVHSHRSLVAATPRPSTRVWAMGRTDGMSVRIYNIPAGS